MSDLKVIADGLAFPEGPRWHDGRLWFSDMHDAKVKSVSHDGDLRTEVEMPEPCSGLGWLPDGRLLIVSMGQRRLLRREDDGRLVEHANLWDLATYHCNDMVVDGQGRAYVGHFGFDFIGGGEPRAASVILVLPDGQARIAAEDMSFPNGSVVTPDGRTLIVGESGAARLTAFDIQDDGSLANRRVFAQLDGAVPDGICLDAEGAVWLANPVANGCLRVREGGDVLARVSTGELRAYACMLGGEDRRTLFVCTAKTHHPEEALAHRTGRIEAVEVEVSGAGIP